MPTVTIRLDDETSARLKVRFTRSGETVSEFIRVAVTKHLNSKTRVETRLESLTRLLDRIEDTGESDLSTTYKARIQGRLRAKHRR